MSIGSSKIFQMQRAGQQGFQFGGPVGAVAGVVAASHPGSPLGNAMGLYSAGKTASGQIGAMGADSSTPQTDQNFKQPQMGSQFQGQSPSIGGDAMSRSLQSQQQKPDYLVNQALSHLNDPEIANSMPYETYMAAVEPLLRAKHFGQGGGYT